jgi:wyosine [tRNA(Phe)-imidazoG37] synthetase (radical SAM superfamily)
VVEYKQKIDTLLAHAKLGRLQRSEALYEWSKLIDEIEDLVYDYSRAVIETEMVLRTNYTDPAMHAAAIVTYKVKLDELNVIKGKLEEGIPPA